MNLTAELERLALLHQSGAIDDTEFHQAKERLLAGGVPGLPLSGGSTPVMVEEETRRWALILHLSQLAGYLLPLAGIIAPILIWQLRKSDLPGLDPHGKAVCNWIISELIYGFVSLGLAIFLIGIPLLIVLGVLGIVFPIIGGIKANTGEVWKYPLAIPFFT